MLTFPHFMQDSMFAHRSAHNPSAMLLLSAAALVANVAVFGYHIYKVRSTRRNPLTQEVYWDTPYNQQIARENGGKLKNN